MQATPPQPVLLDTLGPTRKEMKEKESKEVFVKLTEAAVNGHSRMVPSPKLPRSCPSRAQQFLDYGSGDPANRGLGLSISLAVKSQMSQRRKPVKYNAAHRIEHVASGQQ